MMLCRGFRENDKVWCFGTLHHNLLHRVHYIQDYNLGATLQKMGEETQNR